MLVIGLDLAALSAAAAIKQFGRMSPADAARLVRQGGGVSACSARCCCCCAAGSASRHAVASAWPGLRRLEAPAGSPRVSRGWRRRARRAARSSTARSAMIEMRLDHDSGAMTGTVLAGAYGGRALELLSRPELLSASSGARARRSRRRSAVRDISRPPVRRLA